MNLYKIYNADLFELIPQMSFKADVIVSLPPFEWGNKLHDNWTVLMKSISPNIIYWRGEKLTSSKVSNEWKIILDPCMGQGDVGLWALSTNRTFIGIEIDKARFESAKERLTNYTTKGITPRKQWLDH